MFSNNKDLADKLSGKRVLTFGELMLRLAPTNNLRIEQANNFNANYGGAEANVAASLALQNDNASYLSVVPNNRIGQCALRDLNAWGVDTSKVIRKGDRLGVYFFEVGSSVRSNSVVYDRKYSAISMSSSSDFDWDAILADVDIFYFSGITPAISSDLADACLCALKACRSKCITTVCDLNYRGKMWSPQEAQKTMKGLLKYVDIVVANDEDAPSALGIKHGSCSLSCGIDEKEEYINIARDICNEFGCKCVASVIRNISSVESSKWMSMIYTSDDDRHVFSQVHDMHVLEGVAAGDAFAAGLIHAYLHDYDMQYAADYAIAASVLKLTIHGDTNIVTEAEIAQLANNALGATRVAR